ncbi:MAG: type I-C CRISPR-associated protein Cas5 [Magnetococcales bacterium]|nr:type I-C CRISPR-associated protein Cas5 [Magnetococcales bacterium]
MAYGVKLKVWGDWACFTRPEMKVERVSYDCMTPSAARGILEAIHWKPAIRWVVDRIHVLNPIRFASVRRNELEEKLGSNIVGKAMKDGRSPVRVFIEDHRQQRATLALREVAYVIEAHFRMTPKAGSEDNEGKHAEIFRRRAARGQCHHRPYLGCREFPAHFELVEGDPPVSALVREERDLGWMLHDLDFPPDGSGCAHDSITPRFFRPRLVNGVVDCGQPEVRS